jgi:PadR family transcriptional regulator, regulatory protein PadR
MVVTSGGSERSSQLLKGVLDMCLLSIIDEEPSYGYEMVRKLSDRGLDLVSDGTIYPLLSRLQRQGLIEGYLVESSGGPARKYYRTAPEAAAALEEWERDWRTLVEAVDRVLTGGSDD